MDFIRDSRGYDNRYEVHKHNYSKKEKEFFRIQRKKSSYNRSSTRSGVNNTFIVPQKCLDDQSWFLTNTTEELNYELEPVFHSKDDCLAFELHELIETDDVDEIETLLLYSDPDSLEKSINICGRPEGWLYPMGSPLMAAARRGNDQIVRLLLYKYSTIDINFTTDANIELKRDKIYKYLIGQNWTRTFTDHLLSYHHFWSCFCRSERYTCDDCDLLYRVYGLCNYGLGKTALWLACFHGHLDVVRTLVEIGKADVHLSDRKNWTPLRAAISQGHIHIVKYLIEQSNAIIDETRDLFIAIKYGNYDIIDYLLDKGCDSNTRLMDESEICEDFDYTYFALHYTINYSSENLSTIKTLLKHGSDPTIKDSQGETALHLAIHFGNKEIVQEILHYGFKHDQRNESNLTPLMLAMVMNLTDIIDLFYEILPRQQYIDEIMLLASYYTLQYRFDFTGIDPRAFIYFEQGLKLQESNSNVLPCDVYQFRRECQTIDELLTIQFNAESMYIQALLVYERLLPQRNETFLLIPKLFDFYRNYWNTGDYEQCLLILTHLYPMILSCKENAFYVWDQSCLNFLVTVLGLLIVKEEIKHIDHVFQAFKWAFNRLYSCNDQICRLTLYVAYLIETNKIDIDKKCQLICWVKEAIHQNYASTVYNNILFHQAIVTSVHSTEPLFDRISHENFLHLLLYCGADVNEDCGYRPLHQVALISDHENAQSIIEILIAAGTHTDCLDYQGLLPEQRASNFNIRNFLHTKRSRSLKCQCTQFIISKEIKYQSYLSNHLKNFILMHQSR